MGDHLTRMLPARVETNSPLKKENIAAVACGLMHSSILTVNGNVYNAGGGDQVLFYLTASK